MAVIARTCDRCARFAEDCTVIEDAYICGDCRAEIAAEDAEVEALRSQLRGAVEALEAIRRLGAVCDQYEICEHRACRDSYAAWALADQYLGGQ